MNAAMLATALFAQCSGGSCPYPTFGIPTLPALRYVEPTYAPAPIPAEIPTLERHRIDHEGLDLVVEGRMIDGQVTWEPGRPFNAKSLRDARAARAATQAPKAAPAKKNFIDGSGTLHMFPQPRTGPGIGQVAGQPKNFGLVPERLSKKGFTAKSAEARQFVAEATEGDSGGDKLHLTVIGPDDARKAVLDDLKSHPSLTPFRETLLVQDYKPGEWPVDPSLGFATGGSPTIMVQAARGASDPEGGRVLYRAENYSGGAERLAEALRKAKPNYDPKLDPGPATGKSGSCPFGFTKDHWPAIVAVGAALLFLLVRLPRKEG